MITALLLIIIYLSFISLGLPDTIIGVTIPALQNEFGISLASGGLLSMIVILGTVLSSFLSDGIIRKWGTGKIVLMSCAATGLSLLGFSLSPSFYWLLLLAFPLGFGGGTVDVALNNYVAHNFRAHHMNWLHSFWGVGATLGPIIMAWNLKENSWQGGFSTIAAIQLSLALLLLLSLSLWKMHKSAEEESAQEASSQKNLFKIPGIPSALATMLIYCSIEIGTGLWGSSYLISVKGFHVDIAARYIALYYTGITLGRVLSGFISFKLSNRALIRLGICGVLAGITALLLPSSRIIGAGVIMIGLGLAPVFPAMIHEAPRRFGKEISQRVIGCQMGFAYIGSALVPPVLGLLYQEINLSLFPLTVLLMTATLLLTTERLNRVSSSN